MEKKKSLSKPVMPRECVSTGCNGQWPALKWVVKGTALWHQVVAFFVFSVKWDDTEKLLFPVCRRQLARLQWPRKWRGISRDSGPLPLNVPYLTVPCCPSPECWPSIILSQWKFIMQSHKLPVFLVLVRPVGWTASHLVPQMLAALCAAFLLLLELFCF